MVLYESYIEWYIEVKKINSVYFAEGILSKSWYFYLLKIYYKFFLSFFFTNQFQGTTVYKKKLAFVVVI